MMWPDKLYKVEIPAFKENDEIIKFFEKVEKMYWDYIDIYCETSPTNYPYISLLNYTKQVLRLNNIVDINIEKYAKIYNNYKKNLPTAGIIFYTKTDKDVQLLLVKIRTRQQKQVWSMPKGKYDSSVDYSLLDTAIREFYEETGVKLQLYSTAPSTKISSTLFYIHEKDPNIPVDIKYNSREIIEIKWASIDEIMANKNQYSKQVYMVTSYLKEKLLL